MGEAAMLERHIMQAQARAMSADERELNRVSSGFQRFPDLGLPPSKYIYVYAKTCTTFSNRHKFFYLNLVNF